MDVSLCFYYTFDRNWKIEMKTIDWIHMDNINILQLDVNLRCFIFKVLLLD